MLKEFEAVAKRLEADFEESKAYKHPGLKGLIREKAIVKELLDRYLPKRYAIGSGIIIDSGEGVSRQQDIVIYDELNGPVLQNHEGAQLLFAEQVLTTIEVKSVLDKPQIEAVLENSLSVGRLNRRSGGLVTIASGVRVRSTSLPIVSLGVAFTSPLSLNRIRDEVQRFTRQVDQRFWPSAFLVLRDRNQQAGLVVTVDAHNLRQVLLFPVRESRIASVKTPTVGTALLYFYLLLLQRLELGRLASPSPDYLAYARQSGLSEFELSIGKDALQGTQVDWEGQSVEVDDVTKIKELQDKLNSDISISDQEILDLYGTAIRLPNIDTGFRPGTVFVIDNVPWTRTTPEEVGDALDRLQSGKRLDRDDEVLLAFTQMIRSIQTSSSPLSIIDTQSGARQFLWIGPSLNASGSSVQA